MQTKQWFVAAIAASTLLCSTVRNTSAETSTNQAFQIEVTLKSSYFNPATGKLGKATITTPTIIDLALGINVNTPVPTNVVLAMVINCDANDGFVAVVDTTASNAIMAVVGELQVDGSVDSSGKGVTSMLIGNFNSGSGTNGLYGGWLAIGGSVTELDPEFNLCAVTGFKGKTVSGIVQGLNALLGGRFKVTVTGGSLKSVKSIGYVSPIF